MNQRLIEATKKGLLKTAKLLLLAGADVNFRDPESFAALHYAARYGHVDVAKMLLDYGADVEAKTKDGSNPLHFASYQGHVEIMKLFLDKGANIEAFEEWSHNTALHCAALKGHLEAVKLLIECGANINAKNEDSDGLKDMTALHIAASDGNFEIVKFLLDHGADIESKTSDGCTTLHCASLHGHLEVTQLLYEHGANIEDTDQDEGTVLHWAANEGHTGVVKFLLEHGANIEAKDKNGCTALHFAAFENPDVGNGDNDRHIEVVKLLLDHGADIGATVSNPQTVGSNEHKGTTTTTNLSAFVKQYIKKHGISVPKQTAVADSNEQQTKERGSSLSDAQSPIVIPSLRSNPYHPHPDSSESQEMENKLDPELSAPERIPSYVDNDQLNTEVDTVFEDHNMNSYTTKTVDNGDVEEVSSSTALVGSIEKEQSIDQNDPLDEVNPETESTVTPSHQNDEEDSGIDEEASEVLRQHQDNNNQEEEEQEEVEEDNEPSEAEPLPQPPLQSEILPVIAESQPIIEQSKSADLDYSSPIEQGSRIKEGDIIGSLTPDENEEEELAQEQQEEEEEQEPDVEEEVSPVEVESKFEATTPQLEEVVTLSEPSSKQTVEAQPTAVAVIPITDDSSIVLADITIAQGNDKTGNSIPEETVEEEKEVEPLIEQPKELTASEVLMLEIEKQLNSCVELSVPSKKENTEEVKAKVEVEAEMENVDHGSEVADESVNNQSQDDVTHSRTAENSFMENETVSHTVEDSMIDEEDERSGSHDVPQEYNTAEVKTKEVVQEDSFHETENKSDEETKKNAKDQSDVAEEMGPSTTLPKQTHNQCCTIS